MVRLHDDDPKSKKRTTQSETEIRLAIVSAVYQDAVEGYKFSDRYLSTKFKARVFNRVAALAGKNKAYSGFDYLKDSQYHTTECTVAPAYPIYEATQALGLNCFAPKKSSPTEHDFLIGAETGFVEAGLKALGAKTKPGTLPKPGDILIEKKLIERKTDNKTYKSMMPHHMMVVGSVEVASDGSIDLTLLSNGRTKRTTRYAPTEAKTALQVMTEDFQTTHYFLYDIVSGLEKANPGVSIARDYQTNTIRPEDIQPLRNGVDKQQYGEVLAALKPLPEAKDLIAVLRNYAMEDPELSIILPPLDLSEQIALRLSMPSELADRYIALTEITSASSQDTKDAAKKISSFVDALEKEHNISREIWMDKVAHHLPVSWSSQDQLTLFDHYCLRSALQEIGVPEMKTNEFLEMFPALPLELEKQIPLATLMEAAFKIGYDVENRHPDGITEINDVLCDKATLKPLKDAEREHYALRKNLFLDENLQNIEFLMRNPNPSMTLAENVIDWMQKTLGDENFKKHIEPLLLTDCEKQALEAVFTISDEAKHALRMGFLRTAGTDLPDGLLGTLDSKVADRVRESLTPECRK